MDHLISARWPDLIIINKKERTCRIVEFAVPADHRVKFKESEKKDKYFDLVRELDKLWNIKVAVIPIVICSLSTVTKRLVQGLEDLEIRGRVETIQNTALVRSADWEESWRLVVSQNSSETPLANADVKKTSRSKMIM